MAVSSGGVTPPTLRDAVEWTFGVAVPNPASAREEGSGTLAGGRASGRPGGGRPLPGLGARAGRLSWGAFSGERFERDTLHDAVGWTSGVAVPNPASAREEGSGTLAGGRVSGRPSCRRHAFGVTGRAAAARARGPGGTAEPARFFLKRQAGTGMSARAFFTAATVKSMNRRDFGSCRRLCG